MQIRAVTDADDDALWTMLEPMIRDGETYALPRDMSRLAALAYWRSAEKLVYLAQADSAVAGTYYLKPNQQGGGRHVANCGYLTAPGFSGRGVAEGMCRHSMEEARARGFKAMQFNFVVSSNSRAIRLWRRLGFETVGTLPRAFSHPQLGMIDALVMFREL